MTRDPARESDNLGSRVAGFTIAGLLLLVAVAWVVLYLNAGDEAPRNARVEGISIAGLGADEAEQKLRDGLADRSKEPVDLTYGDGRGQSIDPAAAGLAVDYRASVEEAGGGSGFGPRRMWDVVTGGSDHHAELSVDQSQMQAVLDELDAGIKTPPVEGSIVFRDGRAVPVASKEGVDPCARGSRDCGDVLHETLENHRLEGPSHELHLAGHALLPGGELRGVQRDLRLQRQRLPVLSRLGFWQGAP